MSNTQQAYYNSPIGTLAITANEKGIESILFIDTEEGHPKLISGSHHKELQNCIKQLDEYFTGKRTEFELPLNPTGTKFQLKVWKFLLKISFGKTRSYLEQSKFIGNVKAIRAVGAANGKNPIAIIIPCHRVIGLNGSLTGYVGGVWRKKWLLEHESGTKQQSLF